MRLTSFQNPLQAHSLRILLEASGISASVSGEEINSMFGGPLLHDIGLVGVEVLVRREDLDDAKLIMLEVPAASEILIPAWHCSCGEEVDEGFSICWSCGSNCPTNDDANKT